MTTPDRPTAGACAGLPGDMDASEGTAYHGSVRDLRRDLITSHLDHATAMRPHRDAVHAALAARSSGKAVKVGLPVHDAYTGQMMAAGYAYTLAAVLELAEQLDPGHRPATRLPRRHDPDQRRRTGILRGRVAR